jgi:hypothetical protein
MMLDGNEIPNAGAAAKCTDAAAREDELAPDALPESAKLAACIDTSYVALRYAALFC